MSLLDLLKTAQGGGGLEALASQLGLEPAATEKLAEKLAPAVSSGMQRRAQQAGGLEQVLMTVHGNQSGKYLEDPAQAAAPEARARGEDFLAQIFGSRDAAPELANAAAAEAGVTPEQAQAALPSLAAMLQGAMQQQAPDDQIESARAAMQASGGDSEGSGLGDLLGALPGAGAASSGGIAGMLGGLLGRGGGGAQQAQSGGLGGLLSMLDSDGDGSPLNDIVGKFLR